MIQQRLRGRTAVGLLTALLAVPPALTGCVARDAADAVKAGAARTDVLAAIAQVPARPAAADPLRERPGVYGGSLMVPARHGDPLPERVEKAQGIALQTQLPLTLHEMAAALSSASRIPIRVRDPLGIPAPGSPQLPAADAASGAASPEIAALLAAANAQAVQGLTGGVPGAGYAGQGAYGGPAATLRASQPTMTLQYLGPLSGALSIVAARFGYEWEYRQGGVELYRYLTRTFTLASLPSTATLTSNATSSGAGGSTASSSGTVASTGATAAATGTASSSSGNGSSQSTTTQTKLDYWSELERTIRAMLPPDGTVATQPSSGKVTVVAPRQAMDTVARYIAAENRSVSRRVAISINILSVSIEDSDQYGFDLDVLFRNAGLTLSLSGPASALSAATGAAEVGILPSSSSNFAGSKAAVRALTSTGRAFVDTTDAVTTLNNKPASKRIINRTDFVGGSKVVVVPEIGTSTEIQRITRETGFSFSLLPRIAEDGQIILQYSLTLSDPSTFEPFESGDSVTQLERGNAVEINNEISLPSGATMVLTGYGQKRSTSNGRGTGSPWNLLMGGGLDATVARRQLVVLLTPVELPADLKAEEVTRLAGPGAAPPEAVR